MIEGKKIRGSDNEPNFILIGSEFHKITPDLASFEFVKCESLPNIEHLGYSDHYKALFVQFINRDRYIYRGIKKDVWQERHNYEKLNQYVAQKIIGQGYSYIQTEEFVSKISSEYVLDYLNKLDYYKTVTEGLWATDSPDNVIDTNDSLFQLTF